MTEEQQAEHDSDYQSLVALFIQLLKSLRNENKDEALYALSELRTEIAFKHVVKGLGIEVDNAIQLLKNSEDENLTQQEKDLIDRLTAAILNLIDFSVCEEYQLYDEVLDMVGDTDIDFNSDEYDELLAVCKKYNDQYSAIENSDIEYAGIVAAMWMKMSATDYAVYWTQNDTKVRPWHMALQGYAAPRDEFPSWMIPPIEYNCRCFLEILEVPRADAKLSQIKGSAKDLVKPKQLNSVYSESLAKCGRIFGSTHSYFSVKEEDTGMLMGFVSRLREKYYVSAEV
ncbi:MAG: hypothetical protein JFT10_00030 [Muribaculaceae bacterium]|uniref:Phage head morphogenesis domain-containing protein n=1 Tax=Duncaniella dubosii TaxID=2518971 RepID=A0A4P7W4D4_9BACT|nr:MULTISPECIES: hypothetical protein [Muribaculaceae]MBJ2189223.1 hypothetical protein [Muribaculaceae bacterium]MCX4278053.1 hypothetical protein [Muribaculum sp.]QCD42752.1 hypothetical protein E7747_10950 [Duncaniella dubosii]